jgi:hypothetical protein
LANGNFGSDAEENSLSRIACAILILLVSPSGVVRLEGSNMMKKLCLAALFLTVSATASAGRGDKDDPCRDKAADQWGRKVVCAPEIDPTAAFAGLALALGGLAVLRGRRVKSTEK